MRGSEQTGQVKSFPIGSDNPTMDRNREPFGRWLIRQLIGAVVLIVFILVAASVLPEVIESIMAQALRDISTP